MFTSLLASLKGPRLALGGWVATLLPLMKKSGNVLDEQFSGFLFLCVVMCVSGQSCVWVVKCPGQMATVPLGGLLETQWNGVILYHLDHTAHKRDQKAAMSLTRVLVDYLQVSPGVVQIHCNGKMQKHSYSDSTDLFTIVNEPHCIISSIPCSLSQ